MNITSYKNYLSSRGSNLGDIKKRQSDMLMDATFDRDPTYKQGMLYNANMEPIEIVEFKFQKAQVYTINKDQVEYFVQFKTDYHPEKKANVDDKVYQLYDDGTYKKRLSFYLDIPDDDGDISKWLIVGRNNDNAFVRYNVLQCNHIFEWMIGREYHSCLGVLRSRNNYNSGVWSDGFTTSVENQTQFFVPTNDYTRTINYDVRFMITDNPTHPKTYEVTKVEDTFPLGIFKITLVQDHYNAHTDVCKVLNDVDYPELNDGQIHMICNYNDSELPPIIKDKEVSNSIWYLSEVGEKLYINSTPQIIYALTEHEDAVFDNKWNIFLDNQLYAFEELDGYFEFVVDDINCSLSVKAVNRNLAGYILKVSIGNQSGTYYDFVEMEVVN